MPDQTTLKNLEKDLRRALQERDALQEKLAGVNETIRKLEMIQRILRKLPDEALASLMTSIKPSFGPNATIGDAMEAVLTEAKKPLPKDEIIEKLRQNGVGISLNNPKVVLAIAIKRDKKQRFDNLEDGRVALKGRK